MLYLFIVQHNGGRSLKIQSAKNARQLFQTQFVPCHQNAGGILVVLQDDQKRHKSKKGMVIKMTDRIITDISDYIFVSDKPEKADAIFLPGGSHPSQPEYAAELYREGYAKYVIPSGGVSVKRDKWPGVKAKKEIYSRDYKTDCEFFTDVLTRNGVPVSAVIGEDKSGHTRDNAFFSRVAVDTAGVQIKTAIIVCKEFHARRCLMLYSLAFPDVQFKVCPVNCYDITKDNWYLSEVGIDRVLGELSR